MSAKAIPLTPDNVWKIGGLVREIREEKGFKQKQISDAMGVTQSAVSQLEAGDKIPAIYTLMNYLDCIGYDVVLIRRR